jgi:hypothetical protein
VLLRLTYLAVTNAFAMLRLLPMSDLAKEVEILALRHRIAVLERHLHGAKVRFTPTDRAFLAALLHRAPSSVLYQIRLLVRPETVLRWHRDLIAARHAHAVRAATTSLPASSAGTVGRDTSVNVCFGGGGNTTVGASCRTSPPGTGRSLTLPTRFDVVSAADASWDRPAADPDRCTGGDVRAPSGIVDAADATICHGNANSSDATSEITTADHARRTPCHGTRQARPHDDSYDPRRRTAIPAPT